MDDFSAYEKGFDRLLKQLGDNHPSRSDVLTYQYRLWENIKESRLHNDTPQLSHDRSKIVTALNKLALNELGTSFNELCGLDFSLDELPSLDTVFIGRADEIREFEQALSVIVRSPDPASAFPSRRVFLIRGEGGMGKTTLLKRYVSICETYQDNLFWVYIDWEEADIDSQRGTPKMIDLLATRFQKNYRREFANYQNAESRRAAVQEEINRLRLEFKGDSREDFERFLEVKLRDQDYEFYKNSQQRLSEAFVADLVHLAEVHPVVLLFDTYEVVWHFADQWVRKGLIRFCLIDPKKVGHRFLFVIAGRVPEDPLELQYRDDIREFSHDRALYYKTLDRFTSNDIIEYFEKM